MRGEHLKETFRVFLSMALQSKMSWKMLNLHFQEVTATFNKAKILNEVLLEEHQKLYEELCSIKGHDLEKDDTAILTYQNGNHEAFCETGEILLEQDATQEMIQYEKDCLICGERFLRISDYENHKSIHDDQEESATKIAFTMVEEDMQEKYQPENSFEEDQKKDSTANGCEDKKIIDSEERFTKCETCKKSFATKSSLNQHKRIHTGEKPFQCRSCSMSFTVSSNLKRHERTHSAEKSYQREVCSQRFSSSVEDKSHRNVHLKQHETNTISKQFSCEVCLKSFSILSNMKRHQSVHTGIKPYVCKTCDKRFAQKNNLESHERIHSGEVPFECTNCGKRFSQRCGLDVHKRFHTREKPYTCKYCAMSFSYHKMYKKHEASHEKEQEV